MPSSSAIRSSVSPSQSLRWTTARWSAGRSPRAAEGALIGLRCRREDRQCLAGELLVAPLPRAPAADQVNGQIMRQPEQEGPFVAHALQQVGALGHPDKHLLQEIARVRFLA